MKRIDRWIFEEFRLGTEALGLFRILFCLYLLHFHVTWPAAPLADLPSALYFAPPGLAQIFDGYWSAGVFQVVELLIPLLSVFLLVGFLTAPASIGVSVLLIGHASMRYATGKIDHDFILLVLPAVMAFSGWGGSLSVDALFGRHRSIPANQNSGSPIAFMALLLGFTYLSSALFKGLTGWLDPSSQALRAFVVIYRDVFPAADIVQFQSFALAWLPTAVWELLDWVTILFEASAIVAIGRRNWLQAWIITGVVFHAGVMLLLGIDFSKLVFAYALFLDWTWATALLRRVPIRLRRLVLVGMPAYVVAVFSGSLPNYYSLPPLDFGELTIRPGLMLMLVFLPLAAASLNPLKLFGSDHSAGSRVRYSPVESPANRRDRPQMH